MPPPGDHATRSREREASARLEELEALYRHSPVGLCVLDRTLRFERANDAFLKIVGLELSELLGRTVEEAICEFGRDIASSVTSRVIESGDPALGLELRGLSADDPTGSRSWLVNVHPVIRQGEVCGAMASFQEITSVRRTAETARQRLAELESVYRNAPVGLSFIDPQLRYVRVNQAIADMNGVALEQILGRTYRDLSPETADVAEPFLKRIIEREQSLRNLEVRSTPPADPGQEHVYLLSMDPVRDAGGDLVGYTTAVQDVTELRRAQETAAQHLEELEILYANTPVGLCYLDPELRIAHLNPLFAQLGERPLAEQIGSPASEVWYEQVAEQLVPQLRSVVRMGAGFSSEIRTSLPRSGARERVWIAHAHPVASRSGELSGVVAVLQDITVLAQRQLEVAAVRDRLQEAQRVAQVGSWEWNVIEDEVWWSPELYTIFGETPDYEPTYDAVFEHVHPEDQSKFREQIDKTFEEDAPYRITFRLIRPDGSERIVFAAARLDRTADETPARLVGTLQDVTDLDPRPQRPQRNRRRNRC